ncbi:non-ribosomal peptide synthetase [Terracidiphilus gabretensis]|uniref:non-ribosomal peptide synthetase n=1 Tax=Terracidiphilus gabretensis TaxID=1577687 RepID=UPI00071B026F|nr:non-ribosomal peptide synthetase [Terracidiphilus gabretensis]
MDLCGSALSVRAALDAVTALQPDAAFLISSDSGVSVTFRELRDHSLLLSKLLAHSGIQSGDKVAFLMDNGLLPAQLFLGAMYGGFVAVPLNVRAGAMQLAYMMDHCDAKVVFVQSEYRELLGEALAGVRRDIRIIEASVDGRLAIEDEALNTEIPSLLTPAPAPDDIAMLMYSSGSTGKPKGALHTHSSILAHGRNSIMGHQLSAADRSLLVLPLYHINAECVTLVPTLLSGGSVVIAHRFAVNRFWDWIDDFRITWSALVPTIISELVNWDDPGKDRRQAAFQRIRFFRSSSAPLSPSLQQQFLDKFNLPLIQAMGSTEGGNVFSNPVPPAKNKLGSPGLPWGFETRIIDREGIDVPQGDPGEVLLRSPALMKCYYKDPEGTAAVVDSEGWLHTGDLARQDEDGYFFVVGRSKELIIKGGVNIAPRQIDEVLESHPAILEAAAVGIPDRYFGEEAVAFAVLRDGSTADERELLTFCETRLGHFKTPARIYFLKELPKGPSGKVQRLRLLDPEILATVAVATSAETTSLNDSSLPGDESNASAAAAVEQIIAAAWAEVLNVPTVDTEANFFALGGHSLLAIQCISKLRTKLPVVLTLADFFENCTVAEQARLVRQKLHGANVKSDEPGAESSNWEESFLRQYVPPAQESIPHLNSTLPHPLSPLQQRLWFMEKLNPDVPVYNESEAVLLTGNLNVIALKNAFNVIVARHEALRSTIDAVDGVPHAVIHQSWPPQFREFDLSELAPAKRQSELDRLLIDEPRIPYSLETVPGIRVALVRLSEHEHALILCMHHIICDWASEGILWRELSVLYRSYINGEQADLPALPITHRDYSVWNEKRFEETDFSEDLAFWEENLKGVPALLEVPADRPRPAMASYQGKRVRRKLSPELTEALRGISRREKTSLFTIFTAALDTVLYRYTGTDDILIGLPIGDRDLPELQSIIGFLLHTHVLRTTLSGDIPFRDLLSRVQKGVLDLYAHRAVPFDHVVRKLQPERNQSYSPLFQVMLNWRDRDQQLTFIGLEGLAIESLMATADTCKFDLYFFVTDGGEEVWLELEYNTDIFDQDRISRLLGHYQTVLESVVIDPGITVGKIPLLTAGEYEQTVVDWNRTQIDFHEEESLDRLIDQQIRRVPEKIAVSYGDEQLSYRKLDNRINQLASHLQQLGVKRNDLVAISVERSIDMIVGLLGIMRAGAAYLPLDPTFPPERLAFMLQDAQPSVLLTQEKLRTLLPRSQAQVVALDALSLSADTVPSVAAEHGPEDLAYVLYTSGSTGTPKGVQIQHRALVNFMLSMQREPGITADDTLLAITTLSFDIAGLELYLPLTVGAHLVIAPNEVTRDGQQLLALMESTETTMMQATPATWRMLLNTEWYGAPNLTILCGGESWSSELASQLLPRCKSLWNMYGPTETTIWSATSQVQALGVVRIGQPIANTSLYVLDHCNQPAAVGVPGELHIGGRGLALGYLGRAELTSQRFIPNSFSKQDEKIYKTGDLVRRFSDGSIEFLGRLDHQIKLRGFRIELGEIEAVLGAQPGISQCVITLQELDSGEQRLVAHIVPDDPGNLPSLDELSNTLKLQLPAYMIPSTFSILERMPLTANGKVDRKALLAPVVETLAAEGYEAPQGEMEMAIASILAEVLQLERVGRKDNFFSLGGHSLLVLKVVQKINKRFEVDLRVAEFFQNPTIPGVMEALKTRVKQKSRLINLRPAHSTGQIFFMDAAVGLCRLAEAFDPGPAVFATDIQLDQAIVNASVENRVKDLPSMEEFAQPCVNLILQEQPSGPCVLVGHSFGGLLAFEVARQLRLAGRKVDAVVILDTTAPLSIAYRLKNLTFSRVKSAIKWRITSAVSLVSSKLGSGSNANAPELPDAVKEEIGHYQGALVDLPWDVRQKINWTARDRYQCRPGAGRGILVRARELRPTLHFQNMGWDGMFRDGLQVVDADGDHMSLLAEENVHGLAKAIQNYLSPLMTFKAMETAARVEQKVPSLRPQ